MRRMPMPRDVRAAADPDAVVLLHVVEEALQRREPPGTAHEAAVQPTGGAPVMRRMMSTAACMCPRSVASSTCW